MPVSKEVDVEKAKEFIYIAIGPRIIVNELLQKVNHATKTLSDLISGSIALEYKNKLEKLTRVLTCYCDYIDELKARYCFKVVGSGETQGKEVAFFNKNANEVDETSLEGIKHDVLIRILMETYRYEVYIGGVLDELHEMFTEMPIYSLDQFKDHFGQLRSWLDNSEHIEQVNNVIAILDQRFEEHRKVQNVKSIVSLSKEFLKLKDRFVNIIEMIEKRSLTIIPFSQLVMSRLSRTESANHNVQIIDMALMSFLFPVKRGFLIFDEGIKKHFNGRDKLRTLFIKQMQVDEEKENETLKGLCEGIKFMSDDDGDVTLHGDMDKVRTLFDYTSKLQSKYSYRASESSYSTIWPIKSSSHDMEKDRWLYGLLNMKYCDGHMYDDDEKAKAKEMILKASDYDIMQWFVGWDNEHCLERRGPHAFSKEITGFLPTLEDATSGRSTFSDALVDVRTEQYLKIVGALWEINGSANSILNTCFNIELCEFNGDTEAAIKKCYIRSINRIFESINEVLSYIRENHETIGSAFDHKIITALEELLREQNSCYERTKHIDGKIIDTFINRIDNGFPNSVRDNEKTFGNLETQRSRSSSVGAALLSTVFPKKTPQRRLQREVSRRASTPDLLTLEDGEKYSVQGGR